MVKKSFVTQQVKFETHNQVLQIILNRPEAHNALTPEMMDAVTYQLLLVPKNKNIRAVSIKATGPSFCAGGDLNWMRQSIKYNLTQNMKDAEKLSKMYDSIFNCPVPVLAEIHGNIFGGGLGLIATCDIVAAELASKFCFSELKIGMVPSMIAPYVLRKMPENLARLYFLTAELFDSKKAQESGLVHFVGSKDECYQFVSDKLKMICSNAPEATRVTKDLIHKVKAMSREQSRKLSIKTIAQRRISAEGQDGLNAFFEKRSPRWRA